MFAMRTMNATHIQNVLFPSQVLRFDDVWPSIRRPLGHIMVDAPNNVEVMLQADYGDRYLSICKTHFWSHAKEGERESTGATYCSSLHEYFPFVVSGVDHLGQRVEQLVYGDNVLYKYYQDEDIGAVGLSMCNTRD